MPMGDNGKSKSKTYPGLSSHDTWLFTVPLSSTTVERLFGRMRAMEAPQRGAMKEPMLEAELMFRCNAPMVSAMLHDALKRL